MRIKCLKGIMYIMAVAVKSECLPRSLRMHVQKLPHVAIDTGRQRVAARYRRSS